MRAGERDELGDGEAFGGEVADERAGVRVRARELPRRVCRAAVGSPGVEGRDGSPGAGCNGYGCTPICQETSRLDQSENIPALNWIMSAVLTLKLVALSPKVLQMSTIWAFSPRSVHSFARMREPSHEPGKQSWNAARMAARASSVHAPSEMKVLCRSEAMSVHTVGQVDWRFAGATGLAEKSAWTRYRKPARKMRDEERILKAVWTGEVATKQTIGI